MKFELSKVYTAATAEMLEPGDLVICADNMSDLKVFVGESSGNVKDLGVIEAIGDESINDRFKLANDTNYALAYLVKKIEYRPFKSTKELVEVFEKIANILPYDYKFFMPFIWIKNKGTGDKELILTFGKHEYYTENSSGDMKALLDYYTFLDGTPCGVKK